MTSYPESKDSRKPRRTASAFPPFRSRSMLRIRSGQAWLRRTNSSLVPSVLPSFTKRK